jgi:hypothetical protein
MRRTLSGHQIRRRPTIVRHRFSDSAQPPALSNFTNFDSEFFYLHYGPPPVMILRAKNQRPAHERFPPPRVGDRTPSMSLDWFTALFNALEFEGCSSHSGGRSFITKAARNPHKAGCSSATYSFMPAIARSTSRKPTSTAILKDKDGSWRCSENDNAFVSIYTMAGMPSCFCARKDTRPLGALTNLCLMIVFLGLCVVCKRLRRYFARSRSAALRDSFSADGLSQFRVSTPSAEVRRESASFAWRP